MRDFEHRLVTEERELSSKIQGLTAFVSSPRYDEISHLQQSLLKKQLDAMITYLSILRCRMVDLSIPMNV